MAEVENEMLALTNKPSIESNVVVNICRYLHYGKHSYFAKFWDLSTEALKALRDRYVFHQDSICWDRAILPTRFQYMNLNDSQIWTKQVR